MRKPASFAGGLDFAAPGPRASAVPQAFPLCQTRTQASHDAGFAQAASGATLATLISACGGGSASPTSPSGMASALNRVAGRFTAPGVQVTISGSALANDGGAVLVESTAGVFLLARTSASTFFAVEAVCTHEGCTITGVDGAAYVCPCHGSRYSRSGQVLEGPARASLRQYTTTVTDGVVTIVL